MKNLYVLHKNLSISKKEMLFACENQPPSNFFLIVFLDPHSLSVCQIKKPCHLHHQHHHQNFVLLK